MSRSVKHVPRWIAALLIALACIFLSAALSKSRAAAPQEQQSPPEPAPAQSNAAAQDSSQYALRVLWGQTQEQVDSKSAGCVSCHTSTDSASMHPTDTVHLGCTDCHGGKADAMLPTGTAMDSEEYRRVKDQAHVHAHHKENDRNFIAPVRQTTDWIHENADFVQFVNPGDLRVAYRSCGTAGCHVSEVYRVRTSMMSHGGFLWAAALYNNGAVPFKNGRFGESYDVNGNPQKLTAWPPPTPEETRTKGWLPYLLPLERWEISQPGNVLRVFERGGGKREEIGNFGESTDNGAPDVKLSERGFGTELRTDPVFLGIQKTRLHAPLLYMPGTNDHPGDYRGSGCSGCHVAYANDRDPEHSGPYAQYGNEGKSIQADPTTAKDQHGHPLRHVFTRSIPSSQCIVCHIHPGTNMLMTYYGDIWWDNEVDGDKMYPKKQINPSEEDYYKARLHNPEGVVAKGLWNDYDFLKKVGTPEFNKDLKFTQFGDFHGHGWVFREVFKRDRKGNLLDENGGIVSPDDPEKFKKAVQLKDIHLEKGMHCVDCHFEQDNHGTGHLYSGTRDAVEIQCADCHGTIEHYATLVTSGPAAPDGGTKLRRTVTPWREDRFFWKDGKLYQRSNLNQGMVWEVVQVKDTITPGAPHYNEKSRLAKTILKDGKTWGSVPSDLMSLAHTDSRMTCASCHTSWTTSCFGCHLPMTANKRMPMLHNEGTMLRNWTAYDFQVLRDDVYMLGIDGTVTGNKVSPVRSACAVIVSSQNALRDWIYYEQQTVSTEGFSGQAFSTYVPHTVRAKETKQCTDCHVSKDNDNNAWMASVLIQGTNFVNFLGHFTFVANGNKGFSAIELAERNEPEAMFGSDLHELAYPDNYKKFVAHKRELREEILEHPGKTIYDVLLRGEYVYAALGKHGIRIYDVANLENKDFSERMITAPVSPLGQQLYVPTKDARAIAAPITTAVDPTRSHLPENEEQTINLITGFLYVADMQEGLVIIGDASPKSTVPGVSTLLDGEPRNNFLQRALAFNPDGALTGARRVVIVGVYAYVICDKGLVVVDLHNPAAPKITGTVEAPDLKNATGISAQFRYVFITDSEGLKVVDITDIAHPVFVKGALVPIEDARNVTVARTYAYVSAGKQGIVIADVEKPDQPKLDQTFNAGGQLNDTNDIEIGMVSSSQFALVADGKNGFKVIQTFSPLTNPNFYGFSPKPTLKLIAWHKTPGIALKVSRGIDRDRAVDESGNQMSVFGRRGSRPFNLDEAHRMYLKDGSLFTVTNDPPGPATEMPSHSSETVAGSAQPAMNSAGSGGTPNQKHK